MFARLHSSHRFSSSSAIFLLIGIHIIRHTAWSLELSAEVIEKPCHVDRGLLSDDTTLMSLGKANIGT
jgi:hypothetical protein